SACSGTTVSRDGSGEQPPAATPRANETAAVRITAQQRGMRSPWLCSSALLVVYTSAAWSVARSRRAPRAPHEALATDNNDSPTFLEENHDERQTRPLYRRPMGGCEKQRQVSR